MVGGETVDDIHVIPQFLLVFLGHQHWPHLPATGSDSVKVVQGEEEMMGRDLTRHVNSSFLRSLDDQYLRTSRSSDIIIFTVRPDALKVRCRFYTEHWEAIVSTKKEWPKLNTMTKYSKLYIFSQSCRRSVKSSQKHQAVKQKQFNAHTSSFLAT